MNTQITYTLEQTAMDVLKSKESFR